MKRFIVVADGGQTLGPNCQPCDNLQVLGFAWGKNEEEVDDVDEDDDYGIEDDEWYESDDYTWQVPLMLEKHLELGDDLKNTKDEDLIETRIKYLYKWLSKSDMIQFDCERID